ncbi:MAG: hypothetical protein VX026_13870, partial [Myxococcota bacterium]|nr:hypothetical protein [Myxococcota bacterium]
MQRWKRRSLGGGIFVVIVGLYAVSQQICIPALFSGMSAQKCPTTEVIPKLSVVIQNVRRGERSKINFDFPINKIESEIGYYVFLKMIGADYKTDNPEELKEKPEGYVP